MKKSGQIIITGGTVIAKAGLNETGCRAIGPGNGSDNYGSLTIGDEMMVSSERMANAVERKNMCWYRTQVRVEPCDHHDHTYIWSGTTCRVASFRASPPRRACTSTMAAPS